MTFLRDMLVWATAYKRWASAFVQTYPKESIIVKSREMVPTVLKKKLKLPWRFSSFLKTCLPSILPVSVPRQPACS